MFTILSNLLQIRTEVFSSKKLFEHVLQKSKKVAALYGEFK